MLGGAVDANTGHGHVPLACGILRSPLACAVRSFEFSDLGSMTRLLSAVLLSERGALTSCTAHGTATLRERPNGTATLLSALVRLWLLTVA